MTFLEAYAIHGCDVIAIAEATGLKPPVVDRLVNEQMERRYEERQNRPKIRYAGFDRHERSRWRP